MLRGISLILAGISAALLATGGPPTAFGQAAPPITDGRLYQHRLGASKPEQLPPQVPARHVPTHKLGAADAMPAASTTTHGLTMYAGPGEVSGLKAVRADDPRLSGVAAAHAATHRVGAADSIGAASTATAGLVVLAASGEVTSTKALSANDPRLTDARTPIGHQLTHRVGGADALPEATTELAGLVRFAANGVASAGRAILATDSRIVPSPVTSRPGMVSRPPPARYAGGMAHDPIRGATVLWGGRDGNTYPEATWELTGERWSERTATPPVDSIELGSLVWHGTRQRVASLAGYGTPAFVNFKLLEWDGTSWTSPPNSNYSYGGGASPVFDAGRNMIIMPSGVLGNGFTSAITWGWTGSAWVDVQASVPGYGTTYITTTTLNTPAGQIDGAAVYDVARARVVYFGGIGGHPALGPPVNLPELPSTVQATTWELGANDLWANRGTSGPSPRTRPGMAYDADRERTVLFGGVDANGNRFADTWEWDGTAWAQKTPANAPTARSAPQITYDAGLARVVLNGGQLVGGAAASDTWFWDGTDWSEDITSTELQVGTLTAYTAIRLTEGTNRAMQRATFVNGEVTIANRQVQAYTEVLSSIQIPTGTVGTPYVASRIPGNSITFRSTAGAGDQSTFAYVLLQPFNPGSVGGGGGGAPGGGGGRFEKFAISMDAGDLTTTVNLVQPAAAAGYPVLVTPVGPFIVTSAGEARVNSFDVNVEYNPSGVVLNVVAFP